MALTTCPDCSNQYADDAPYCPNCGRPNPARQTGAAGAAPGGTTGATGSPPSETPAGTGSTSSTYTAGTGSAGQGGYTGGANQAPGGQHGSGTGGYTAGPAGGGFGGAAGGAGGTGGYGGGGYAGAPGGEVPPQQIPNYLVQSILVTVLTCFTCCIPIGGIALYFSTQVNSKRDAGDIPGALAASKNAKLWCWITLGIGLAAMVLSMIFGVLTAIMGAVAEQAG